MKKSHFRKSDIFNREFSSCNRLLNSQDELVKRGESLGISSGFKISADYDAILNQLYALHPTGSTALGPAMAVAVGVASKTPGAKVMMCTDGLANIGIGSVEGKAQVPFYSQIANVARKNGTVISCVSMEGEDCSVVS